jgi:mannose-6-phosphate isomerase-like protein (cupin superfamily)
MLNSFPKMVLAIFAALAVAQGQTPAQSSSTAGASASPESVKYYSKDDLAASFSKGGTLIDANNYRIMTAHRTEAGNVEVHRSYTDVFYIVQGSTDIVLAGKVIGEKDTNPDEPRGDSIEGGETRHLATGDAMVIPAGVPHWMKNVQGELLYFVVKVKKPGA